MRRTESWRAEFEARATLRQAIEDARPERIATAELLPGAWDNLSAQDPQTILWTKPAQVLRDMLGVSDVTIVNRAKKYGNPVPGRGFWNKVAAGKIPHPRGVPQKIRPPPRRHDPRPEDRQAQGSVIQGAGAPRVRQRAAPVFAKAGGRSSAPG